MTNCDCYQRIPGLRALRSFREEPLPESVVEEVLEATRWTGSRKNRQSRPFLVVDGEQKERLDSCGDFTDPMRSAPAALALVQEDGGNEFDVGRVAQNVMLAAAAMGMAPVPVTLHREDEVARVLGLPEGARCRYAVALGPPSIDARPRRSGGRKPLEEVAFCNRHGASW